MSISQRLIDRAYRQRIINEAETRPLRHQELSRVELKKVERTLEDLKRLMALTENGRPNGRVVLSRGSVNSYGPERMAVQVEGETVYVVTGRAFRRSSQVMMVDRQNVHADARAKYATALALRDALAEQIGEQDWMITTLRGLANTFSGLLTRTT